MLVSPGAAHAFRLLMVGYNIMIVRKFLMTDCAFSTLLYDLPIQELSHLCG
jgi:hypothetical protein